MFHARLLFNFNHFWQHGERSNESSGFCSSARAFAPRFFQTPPHDDAFALRYHFSSIKM
jgi:hypothetical protein